MGVPAVIEAVGLPDVIKAVGVPAVIEAVGLPKVIETVGAPAVIEAVGLPKLIEITGAENMLAELLPHIPTEELQELLCRRQEKA